MLNYQSVEFKAIRKTGKINITCQEDFNFEVEAYGNLPREKDLIKAVKLMYEQINRHSEGWSKLKTHKVVICSNNMMGRGKIKKNKNRKDVWNKGYHKIQEENFRKSLTGK